jgi:small-conductance mechanosensitive channel
MIIKKPLVERFSNSNVYKIFRAVLIFFAFLLFSAIAGNLAGAVGMAEFFTLIPIQVVVLAIGTQVAISVADTIIFLLLASNTLQRLNVFKEEFRVIYKKSTRFINFLLWLFFVVTAMNIFRIKEPVFEWGRQLLTTGKKIGEVSFTPGSILIFIFVIWLSIFITRIVRHVLEKDVFARVTTAKGMPSTIILLVRIVLIAGGFFLAAAAAGMELTNLSIVLGAFSVGIGFGLQNIFNNMVSGLILAFERPIKVGDTVQVGDLLGVVLSIGLRSSTVRSFDGAEVIVPNGNLISDQMINWTLSDSTRRMDIRVGVAYGTDPEKVIAIMLEAAAEHMSVHKQPDPMAFFIGFGESSLDFRLLAWTDIEHRLMVESDLNVTINTKLKEAGIEIPFPQRDLHIRSDATKESE